jgi:hypothetical protein
LARPHISCKKIPSALSKIKFQNTAAQKVCKLKENSNFKRLTYIRYADDFLLGYTGSKSEAVKLLVNISHFTDSYLGMKLHTKKSGVIHHEKGVLFLGYKIWKKYKLNIKFDINSVGSLQKIENSKLNFNIPLEHLFIMFKERGFFLKASADRIIARCQDK